MNAGPHPDEAVRAVHRIALRPETDCYLVAAEKSRVLIDTGYPHQRAQLLKALEAAGCSPRELALVVLTHGDIDHSGNGAFLRNRCGVRIAMHAGDTAMCLNDGVTRERSRRPPVGFPTVLYLWLVDAMLRYFVRRLLRRERFEPFRPDILLEDGESLRPFGLDVVLYHTPGHSRGSISVLTPDGTLFCGDHFGQVWRHVIASDDDPVFPSTRAKLARLPVTTVCPGHGAPFAAERAGLWPQPAAGPT